MYRLLGIVHMNPEIDGEMWDHIEVRIIFCNITDKSSGNRD